jgi:hypothetical protein
MPHNRTVAAIPESVASRAIEPPEDVRGLAGAGLDEWLVKEMEIGGDPPVWFNRKFLEKLETRQGRPSFS